MTTVPLVYESAKALLHVFENGLASLSDVHVTDLRQGHATGLMKQIEQYADDNNLQVMLEVRRYGDPHHGMSNAQLEQFYSRFGFVRQGERKPIVMIRKANSQE